MSSPIKAWGSRLLVGLLGVLMVAMHSVFTLAAPAGAQPEPVATIGHGTMAMQDSGMAHHGGAHQAYATPPDCVHAPLEDRGPHSGSCENLSEVCASSVRSGGLSAPCPAVSSWLQPLSDIAVPASLRADRFLVQAPDLNALSISRT